MGIAAKIGHPKVTHDAAHTNDFMRLVLRGMEHLRKDFVK
jgi:hypothetical protein